MKSIDDAVVLIAEELSEVVLENDDSGLYKALGGFLSMKSILSFDMALESFYDEVNDKNNKDLNDAFICFISRLRLDLNWNTGLISEEIIGTLKDTFDAKNMEYVDLTKNIKNTSFANLMLFIFRLYHVRITHHILSKLEAANTIRK